ncbi:sterol desaturase family [Acrodontium crateriforme]|uniref:Sterol desaturase family n=1 Tax=Acrodontium crateriforme TaxID=150365 RepID=A0AAQ3M153_9PEZI|nr:sterol desaturase family [Acrodontium crateriforme]
MSLIPQAVRDNALYAYGYLNGRSFAFPRSFSALYGSVVSKATSLVALPLPFLSFLALPFFGGTSTTINLLFFYLTWTALIWSCDPLTVELVGTLAVRLICFLLPALGFLALDCLSPGISKNIKAQGRASSPLKLGRDKLIEIGLVATVNVLLSVALQAAFEYLSTQILHMRSALKVTSAVPLPWNLVSDIFRGLIMRGILRYLIHRFILHTYESPLKNWHKTWQHSVRYPFSIVAAYDHPVNYLVGQWLPVFLPAYFFRYHVLTWHIILAIVSLEDLFVYSGYVGLPSRIMLTGMARRTDAHFLAAQTTKVSGNFGSIGLLDFVCRTTCPDEGDLIDDIKGEAQKHKVRERAENAASGAWEGLKDDQNDSNSRSRKETQGGPDADYIDDADVGDAATSDKAPSQQGARRRGGRRKARDA